MFSCHARHIIGRQHRRIPERFLQRTRQPLNGFQYVRFDDEFVMIGAELLSDHARVGSLVEILISKPNRKRFDWLELALAISATTVEESVPPLSRAPSGTSEISRIRTASASRCSISSRHSSSLRTDFVPYCGRSQY